MKKITVLFIILSAIIIAISSCSVRKSASMPAPSNKELVVPAPSPSVKTEASPNKSEPVPGAEILIEQDNNQTPPKK